MGRSGAMANSAMISAARRTPLGPRGLERLLRIRDEYPRQWAGPHRTAALCAENAGFPGVWQDTSRHGTDAVSQHGLLRLPRLSGRQKDRPHRCLRFAVGHQRAAYVRRHFRRHAADPGQDQRSRPGLGGGPHLGVRAELRADGRRLHRADHPQDHAARRAARLTRRHFDHLHLDAAWPDDFSRRRSSASSVSR